MLGNCNGYIQIQNSTYGSTYQHILVAENKLGRKLFKGEIVHHIDKCRSNNVKDNLIVFKTNADHRRHHSLKANEQKLEQLEDGSWVCINLKITHSNCLTCNNSFLMKEPEQIYCSISCASLDPSKRKVTRPSKEELHRLVWQMPTVSVAKQYGVADSSVAKWCKRYGIPKPAKGFWNKIDKSKLEGQTCPLL